MRVKIGSIVRILDKELEEEYTYHIISGEKEEEHQSNKPKEIGVEIEHRNRHVGGGFHKELLGKVHHAVGDAADDQKQDPSRGQFFLDGVVVATK